jgi:hypothetical protein
LNFEFLLALIRGKLRMTKTKRKAKAQRPKKEKRNFAQTSFSVFQKTITVEPHGRSFYAVKIDPS